MPMCDWTDSLFVGWKLWTEIRAQQLSKLVLPNKGEICLQNYQMTLGHLSFPGQITQSSINFKYSNKNTIEQLHCQVQNCNWCLPGSEKCSNDVIRNSIIILGIYTFKHNINCCCNISSATYRLLRNSLERPPEPGCDAMTSASERKLRSKLVS